MPAVSVLLPCYNAATTLNEALESLQAQTFTDFEVVLVNDGSTDETFALLQSWTARDARFRVFHQAHAGIVAALNAGLTHCMAALVARMDADDRCHPERLGKQVDYLVRHPSTSVVGCQVAGFPAEQVRGGFQVYIEWSNSLITDADLRREMFVESPLVHPSVMFRRIAVTGYEEHHWAEDYDLWLRLYLQQAVFYKIPEVLLEWRESPTRLTRTDGRYSLENFLRAKAHYLAHGPLADRSAVIVWGAGMIGRRLSKYLLRQGLPLAAFVDIDPRKIGRTRHGRPVLAPADLMDSWRGHTAPALLAAVGARGARQLIRARLAGLGLQEGQDWWGVA